MMQGPDAHTHTHAHNQVRTCSSSCSQQQQPAGEKSPPQDSRQAHQDLLMTTEAVRSVLDLKKEVQEEEDQLTFMLKMEVPSALTDTIVLRIKMCHETMWLGFKFRRVR